MVKVTIEWCKNRFLSVFGFLSNDLAVYSGSMSFITVFSFIPFLMLGVFVAINVSFFAEYFNSFREFLYANLFIDSADVIVLHINEFLQNSAKLGTIGVIFALYSVYLFVKQLDYCINKLAGVKSIEFGAQRFLKYIIVIGFATLAVSLSTVVEAIGSFLGLGFVAFFMAGIQMWFAIFLIIFFITPVVSSAKKAALFSFICAVTLTIFKKLFVYYVLFSSSYDTIYGSFAVLFWFFVWLNFSWYIFFASIKLYLKQASNI